MFYNFHIPKLLRLKPTPMASSMDKPNSSSPPKPIPTTYPSLEHHITTLKETHTYLTALCELLKHAMPAHPEQFEPLRLYEDMLDAIEGQRVGCGCSYKARWLRGEMVRDWPWDPQVMMDPKAGRYGVDVRRWLLWASKDMLKELDEEMEVMNKELEAMEAIEWIGEKLAYAEL